MRDNGPCRGYSTKPLGKESYNKRPVIPRPRFGLNFGIWNYVSL